MTKSKSCQSCSTIIFHGKGKEMTSGTLYSNTDCSSLFSSLSNHLLYFFLSILKALGAVYVGVGITGTVTTILLVILFVINVYRHILKSPAKWRRLLAWITSTPMVVSFLSLIIFLVPRAGDICDTVKQV